MHVAVEALDVGVAEADLEAVSREVDRRFTASLFAGVRDLRLRLRSAKGALLCVAVVGFAGGELVTSTATSDTPLTAMVGALDGLPARIDRIQRAEATPAPRAHAPEPRLDAVTRLTRRRASAGARAPRTA